MRSGAGGRRAYLEAVDVVAEDAGEVELLDLLLEAGGKAGVHARPAGKDDVLVEFTPRVDRCGLDQPSALSEEAERTDLNGLQEHFSHARLLDVDEVRLEHALGRLEALRADFDDAAVRELRRSSLSAFGG
jgi:hypothetical protein